MSGYDINSIQPYLSTDLTATSFANGGGSQDNYPSWLQQQLGKRNNEANYTTFDPRLFADPAYRTLGVDTHTMVSGHGIYQPPDNTPKTDLSNSALVSYAQQRANDQASRNSAGNAYAQSQGWLDSNNNFIKAEDQGKKLGDPITSGALGALKNPQPNLQKRQPSLAAGWGGWDQGSTAGPTGNTASGNAGNANFTYFSRFA